MEVRVDAAVSVSRLVVRSTGVDLRFSGDGADVSRISASQYNNAIDVNAGNAVAFSNVYVSTTSFVFPKNLTVRLYDRAQLHAGREIQLNSEGDRLEAYGDSEIWQDDWRTQMHHATARMVLCDSSLHTQKNGIEMRSGARIDLYGDHPRVRPQFIKTDGSDAANPPVVALHVPMGGYASAPFVQSNSNNGFTWSVLLRLEIADDSPAYRFGRKTVTKLVDWPKRITADYLTFADQPKAPATRLWYTYGGSDSAESDGNSPTGLWAELIPTGFAVILR